MLFFTREMGMKIEEGRKGDALACKAGICAWDKSFLTPDLRLRLSELALIGLSTSARSFLFSFF